MYIYNINLYPSLELINKNKNSTIQVDLEAYNSDSLQSVKIKLNKNDISASLSRWWIVIIFIAILIFIFAITMIVFNYITKEKKEEEKPLTNYVPKTTLSRPTSKLKTDRKSKLNRISSQLEVLEEELENEIDSEDSDKGTLRNSMADAMMLYEHDMANEDSLVENSGVHESIRRTFSRQSNLNLIRGTAKRKSGFLSLNSYSLKRADPEDESADSRFAQALEKRDEESVSLASELPSLNIRDSRYQIIRINETFIESDSSPSER